MPGPVLHLSGYPGPRYDGVPGIGEHTRAALAESLAMSSAELDDLARQQVIGPG
jgi:crotonobetainyl-CoA:carnitine CoA-transferase CaiB-like acyl-CoA transferase